MEQDVFAWVASDFVLEEAAIKRRATRDKVPPNPLAFHQAAVGIMQRNGIEADDILYVDPCTRPGAGRQLALPSLPSGRLNGRSLAEYRVVFLGNMRDHDERAEAIAALSSASFPGLVLVGWNDDMPGTLKFEQGNRPETFDAPPAN